jgi:hypothetical protein
MYTFLIILLLSGCGVFESSSTLPTPASPSKQIISNNLPLRELWRWSGIIFDIDKPPHVLVKGEMIVVVSEEGRTANKIIVFEALTGRLIWESEPTFERPDSIAVDDNNVYASGSDATPITIIAFWKK